MSDRRATKNLPHDEWLTSWFGPVRHESKPATYFAGPRAPDRHYLYGVFCTRGYDARGALTEPSLIEELEARGYDVSTLEFRIQRKPKVPT